MHYLHARWSCFLILFSLSTSVVIACPLFLKYVVLFQALKFALPWCRMLWAIYMIPLIQSRQRAVPFRCGPCNSNGREEAGRENKTCWLKKLNWHLQVLAFSNPIKALQHNDFRLLKCWFSLCKLHPYSKGLPGYFKANWFFLALI